MENKVFTILNGAHYHLVFVPKKNLRIRIVCRSRTGKIFYALTLTSQEFFEGKKYDYYFTARGDGDLVMDGAKEEDLQFVSFEEAKL